MRNMIKVLYFIGYPFNMAGSQRQIFELILSLPKDEVKPLVLLTEEAGVSEFCKKHDVDYSIINLPDGLNQYGKKLVYSSLATKLRLLFLDYSRYTKTLSGFLKNESIDLIHCNDPRATMLIGVAARLNNLKIVGHLQGERPFKSRLWRLYEWIPSRFILNAKFIRSSLSARANKIADVIYTGIETPKHVTVYRDDTVVISCFASIVPFKGQHHLIQAIALLNKRSVGINTRYYLVGASPDEYKHYLEFLNNLIKQFEIKNVQLEGWTNNPYEYYSKSDITVLPSIHKETLNYRGTDEDIIGNEGFPTTHLEAMHFSLPVVGTNIAGVGEQIIDGENGFLVEPSSPIALADALQKLIEDDVLRRKMGTCGKMIVEKKFSKEEYVKKVLNIYRSIF